MKEYVPKGKAKRRITYKRELRNEEGIPESRSQIIKFIKDQNKELGHFIQETTENEKMTSFLPSSQDENIFDEQDTTLIDSEEEEDMDEDLGLGVNGDWEL